MSLISADAVDEDGLRQLDDALRQEVVSWNIDPGRPGMHTVNDDAS